MKPDRSVSRPNGSELEKSPNLGCSGSYALCFIREEKCLVSMLGEIRKDTTEEMDAK
jgi:hypothetical protein